MISVTQRCLFLISGFVMQRKSVHSMMGLCPLCTALWHNGLDLHSRCRGRRSRARKKAFVSYCRANLFLCIRSQCKDICNMEQRGADCFCGKLCFGRVVQSEYLFCSSLFYLSIWKNYSLVLFKRIALVKIEFMGICIYQLVCICRCKKAFASVSQMQTTFCFWIGKVAE